MHAARRLEEIGADNSFTDHESIWETLNAETTQLVATLQHFAARQPSFTLPRQSA